MQCFADAQEYSDFIASIEDFLEPPPDNVSSCKGVQLKCKYGPNFVSVNVPLLNPDMARQKCLACDDTNLEPVGGQGGIIRTPIRDDVDAIHYFHKNRRMRQKIKRLKFALGLLVVIALYLIFRRK